MNRDELKTYLNCDDGFLDELIAGFSEEAGEIADHIEQHLQAQEWEKVKRCAHKLLGSTTVLGMDELTQIFKQVENDETSVGPAQQFQTSAQSGVRLLRSTIAQLAN